MAQHHMTDRIRGLAAGLILGMATAPVLAADNVLLLPDTPAAQNLAVLQSPEGGNVAEISLAGDKVLLTGREWQRDTASLLVPNALFQDGASHRLLLGATGSDHQIAVSQQGNGHAASVLVEGLKNIVAVSQFGQGHSAAVTQNGVRNSVVISQR